MDRKGENIFKELRRWSRLELY